MSGSSLTRTAYGDFQTPRALASEIVALLARRGVHPGSVLEPTCGTGHLLLEAAIRFATAQGSLGLDINPQHLQRTRALTDSCGLGDKVALREADFFEQDWREIVGSLDEPVLILGNLPWVTNATLGAVGVRNAPTKRNFDHHIGLDAITGKSNFDISEWMLIHLFEALDGREAVVAMICKTAVARKVLARCARGRIALSGCAMYGIDARRHFGVAVEACLLVCSTGCQEPTEYDCDVYTQLGDAAPHNTIALRDGHWVSDLRRYELWAHLCGRSAYVWRSGLKHDCQAVMELRRDNGSFANGCGEAVELEQTFVYPLLKSTALFRGNTDATTRWVLVPQQTLGEDTAWLRTVAPLTWQYLLAHAGALASRRSSVYEGQPPFAVFGVGPYTFAPWKVAISGLHPDPRFRLVAPVAGRPVVFDDTCYFLPCQTEVEATILHIALNSRPAQEFLAARVFSDSKRPITKTVLQQLDIRALVAELGSPVLLEATAASLPVAAAREFIERCMARSPQLTLDTA